MRIDSAVVWKALSVAPVECRTRWNTASTFSAS